MNTRMIDLFNTQLIMVLLGFLPSLSMAEIRLKPGLWEYKMTMDMPGMPQMPMGGTPMIIKRCLSAEDAKNPSRAFEGHKSKHQCVQEEYKKTGNTISYKVRCSGANPSTGSGEFTIAEDHFEGKMKISMESRQKNVREITQLTSGRRIGECEN